MKQLVNDGHRIDPRGTIQRLRERGFSRIADGQTQSSRRALVSGNRERPARLARVKQPDGHIGLQVVFDGLKEFGCVLKAKLRRRSGRSEQGLGCRVRLERADLVALSREPDGDQVGRVVVGHEIEVGQFQIHPDSPALGLSFQPDRRPEEGFVRLGEFGIGPGPAVPTEEDRDDDDPPQQRRAGILGLVLLESIVVADRVPPAPGESSEPSVERVWLSGKGIQTRQLDPAVGRPAVATFPGGFDLPPRPQ